MARTLLTVVALATIAASGCGHRAAAPADTKKAFWCVRPSQPSGADCFMTEKSCQAAKGTAQQKTPDRSWSCVRLSTAACYAIRFTNATQQFCFETITACEADLAQLEKTTHSGEVGERCHLVP